MQSSGRSMSEALIAGFRQQRSTFDPRSDYVGFVLNKLALGRFSPSTSVSLDNSHSTKCSILIYHPELVQ
jgi:hypothetical protein